MNLSAVNFILDSPIQF